MEFNTVFEIAEGLAPFRYEPRVYVFLVATVGMFGVLSLVWGLRKRGLLKICALWIAITSLAWAALWTAFILKGVRPHREARFALLQRYQEGRYETVEGKVEVLRTQPVEGHSPAELVRVGSQVFKINYYAMTPAYRLTIAHGGALRDGTVVRVSHIEGKIVRIDLADTRGDW